MALVGVGVGVLDLVVGVGVVEMVAVVAA